MTEAKLRMSQIVAFAAPGLATTLLVSPIFSVLPGIYALNTKATLTEIGLIFVVARIIDAITDPLIGVASDMTRTRWGARLPWIVAGAALAIPSSYFLFLPPPDAGSFYFFVTSNICLLAWTMITIPHAAWAAELSSSYDERSRIFAITNFVARVGGFGFFLIPPLIAPFTGTTEINLSTMAALVAMLAIALPATVTWTALKAPIRHPVASAENALSFVRVLRSMVGNKPLLHFVTVTLFAGISAGMSTGLFLLFIQDYFKLGPYFFLMSMMAGIAGMVTIPLWVYVARETGKHIAWAGGTLASAVIGLPLLFLPPGPESLIPVVAIVAVAGIMQGAAVMLPSAMLADIADYEMLKRGGQAQGNYFSLLFLLSKVTTAIGSGAGFWIADMLGYVPNADKASWMLLVPAAIIPGLLSVTGGVLILFAPITRRRHTIIAKRLAQRQARLKAAQP